MLPLADQSVGSKPASSFGFLVFSPDTGYRDRGFSKLPSVKIEPLITSRQLPLTSFPILYQEIIPPFGNTFRGTEGVFIKNKYADKYNV